jgi:hypothetical protein
MKIGEAHAKGSAGLAALETALRQGHAIDAVPIYVTVSCGRYGYRYNEG